MLSIILVGFQGEEPPITWVINKEPLEIAAKETVIIDIAFIQDDKDYILIVVATTDNHIILIDTENNFKTQKIALSSAEERTSRDCSIEWTAAIDYV